MTHVIPDPRYPEASFREPEQCGFIYLGMQVDPPRRLPFVQHSAARDTAITDLKTVAQELEDHPAVITAQVYRTVLIPPIPGNPRLDVVALVRTTSPETIPEVQSSIAYGRLHPAVTITARNILRIGHTDATLSGTFVFNHFTAPDHDNVVDVFKHLSSWYTTKIGVDNITLLQPLEPGSTYAVINYLRIPHGPLRFLLGQFTRPSFHRYVLRGLLRSRGLRTLPILVTPV